MTKIIRLLVSNLRMQIWNTTLSICFANGPGGWVTQGSSQKSLVIKIFAVGHLKIVDFPALAKNDKQLSFLQKSFAFLPQFNPKNLWFFGSGSLKLNLQFHANLSSKRVKSINYSQPWNLEPGNLCRTQFDDFVICDLWFVICDLKI